MSSSEESMVSARTHQSDLVPRKSMLLVKPATSAKPAPSSGPKITPYRAFAQIPRDQVKTDLNSSYLNRSDSVASSCYAQSTTSSVYGDEYINKSLPKINPTMSTLQESIVTGEESIQPSNMPSIAKGGAELGDMSPTDSTASASPSPSSFSSSATINIRHKPRALRRKSNGLKSRETSKTKTRGASKGKFPSKARVMSASMGKFMDKVKNGNGNNSNNKNAIRSTSHSSLSSRKSNGGTRYVCYNYTAKPVKKSYSRSGTSLKRSGAIRRKVGWLTSRLTVILAMLKARSQTGWRTVRRKVFRYKGAPQRNSSTQSEKSLQSGGLTSVNGLPDSHAYIPAQSADELPAPHKLRSAGLGITQVGPDAPNAKITRHDTILIKSLDDVDDGIDGIDDDDNDNDQVADQREAEANQKEMEAILPVWEHYLKGVVAKRISMNIDLDKSGLERQETRSTVAKEALLTNYVEDSSSDSSSVDTMFNDRDASDGAGSAYSEDMEEEGEDDPNTKTHPLQLQTHVKEAQPVRQAPALSAESHAQAVQRGQTVDDLSRSASVYSVDEGLCFVPALLDRSNLGVIPEVC